MKDLSFGRKAALFLLLVLVLDLCTAENAEARRRRFFGRRNRGAVVRVNRNNFRGFNARAFNKFAFNNGGFVNPNFRRFNGFNRFDDRVNINDPFGLARVPADILSNVAIDPTGSLQRLAIAPNIGVDRNGQFFELNGLNSLAVRQPLAFSNGQFFGGQVSQVNPDTLLQMQQVNQSGNFDLLPFQ